MESVETYTLNNIATIADKLLEKHHNKKVFAFEGAMGSGKTTLIKELCLKLKVIDELSSPTFSLINEYQSNVGEPVFHFDFYRIKRAEEILDYGYEEYIYSGNYCFLEWPQLVEAFLPTDMVKVSIEILDDKTRKITF